VVKTVLSVTLAVACATAVAVAGERVKNDGGIAVHFSLRALNPDARIRENDGAEVTVRVTDREGTPISGAGINGWFAPHPPGAPALDHGQCVERVATYTAGGLFNQPPLDLNVYRVAILNADPTISIVDPQISFGGTRLLAMVEIESPGEDWVASRDRRRLFVAMPAAGKVAMIDTTTWKVLANIATGAKTSRLVMQRDGGYVWAAHDAGVTAIDATTGAIVARIDTGHGPHDLALSDDDRTLFVTNAGAGTTSIVDVRKLAVVRHVPTGANPVSVAWSQLAGAAYVVSGSDGAIIAVDPLRAEPRARIAAVAGLTRIRFAPGARLGFITNPTHDKVYIVDAATNRIIQTAAVEKEPFEVTFSDTIAYIRHLGSETVLMIPLAGAGNPGAHVTVADFPGGQRAFGATGVAPIPADGIVQAAGENAVLVTNPADGEIYYYREGMAAPSGDLPAYSHTPRAALVIDRSLREVKPGIFSTVATMPRAGTYDVALFIDSPRAVTCFQVTVASAQQP